MFVLKKKDEIKGYVDNERLIDYGDDFPKCKYFPSKGGEY